MLVPILQGLTRPRSPSELSGTPLRCEDPQWVKFSPGLKGLYKAYAPLTPPEHGRWNAAPLTAVGIVPLTSAEPGFHSIMGTLCCTSLMLAPCPGKVCRIGSVLSGKAISKDSCSLLDYCHLSPPSPESQCDSKPGAWESRGWSAGARACFALHTRKEPIAAS